MTWRLTLGLACGVLLIATGGCRSHVATIAPFPPSDYTDAGRVRSSACGFLLFNVIPIRVHSRAHRAYAEAVRRSSAWGLTDTSITDRWYFAGAGTLLCTDIEATAIRTAQSSPGSRGR
jgi:hypothetical protein